MVPFDYTKYYQSFSSGEALEEKLLQTKKYLSLRANFIEFQNWSSEQNSVVSANEHALRDIPTENEFSREEMFDNEELDHDLAQLFMNEVELSDELARLEEYLAESKTVLIACPENMPRWKNAWWGERVLNELG